MCLSIGNFTIAFLLLGCSLAFGGSDGALPGDESLCVSGLRNLAHAVSGGRAVSPQINPIKATLFEKLKKIGDGKFEVSGSDAASLMEAAMAGDSKRLQFRHVFQNSFVTCHVDGSGELVPGTIRILEDVALLESRVEGLMLSEIRPDGSAKSSGEFRAGQSNSTDAIRKLTHLNGVAIDSMHFGPNATSTGSDTGFLLKGQRLQDVLATDNDAVTLDLRSSHRQVAKPFRTLVKLFDEFLPYNAGVVLFTYNGVPFAATKHDSMSPMASPFRDNRTSLFELEITCLASDEPMLVAKIYPYFIEQYGFYEGPGIPYRTGPKEIHTRFNLQKKQTPPVTDAEWKTLKKKAEEAFLKRLAVQLEVKVY